MKNDILIFLSDQHSYRETSFSSSVVRTPNLSRIGKMGTVFDSAYTSCPLCVPARMSMLTTKKCSKIGVLTNQDGLREDIPTFLHSLAENGYETVLCGRMHFMGIDQRHGFTKRIADDFTNTYWGKAKEFKKELGVFDGTVGEAGCLALASSGTNPVCKYDDYVVKTALDYLGHDYDKPQCIVVGTYAPHFPYVGRKDLFDYYYANQDQYPESSIDFASINHKKQSCSKDKLRRIRAAYRAMVEEMDEKIGSVFDSWKKYLSRNNRAGLFIYTSDHGDNLGDKELFGKKSFFEGAEHIPLVIEGCGVKENRRYKDPVSLMDIGTTLIDYTSSTPLPDSDGKSLVDILEGGSDYGRVVYSELLDESGDRTIFGQMACSDKYKVMKYSDGGVLSFERDDAFELSAVEKRPDTDALLSCLLPDDECLAIIKDAEIRKAGQRIVSSFSSKNLGSMPLERWHIDAEIAKGKDLAFPKG